MNSAALAATGLEVLVELYHQLLDLLAAHRIDFELRGLGFAQEFRVLHGPHESIPQRIRTIVWNARGRKIRPPHHLPREDQLEDLLLLVGLGEIHHQRDIG